MLVGDRMTREVHTLSADAGVTEGLHLMNRHGIHKLPVVSTSGELVGIVSDKDLRIAEAAGRSADPVSTVMTESVVTCSEYCPLEKAATLMREKRVGALPVTRRGKVIGIITDGDIFDVFAELLGVRKPGVRLTLVLPNEGDVMLDLLRFITDEKGEIIALGTMKRERDRIMVLKVAGLSEEEARRAVRVVGVEVVDVLSEG